MESTTNLLTTAGMVKLPFPFFNGLDKVRLYHFSNQQPEDIAKIQTLFELEIKGNLYQGKIFQIFEGIQTQPYLLKEGKIFRLITVEHVFECQQKFLQNNQEIISFYKKMLGIHLNIHPHDELGDPHDVITSHEKNLKLKDLTAVERIYCHLGNGYQKLGDYRSSIAYQKKALKIVLELKDVANEGIAYGNLGSAYYGAGDYRSAIMYHEKELKIALERKSLADEGIAYGYLGITYQALGNYRSAILYHEKELKMALDRKNMIDEGKAYCHLGNAYEYLGDYRIAIIYHEKDLKIALQLKDVAGEGSTYGNLGNAYEGLGDYRRAITYHEKRLTIALQLQDRVGEGKAYNNLGVAYHRVGDYGSSMIYHEKRLKIALQLQDQVGEGKAYCNLGNSHQGLRDYRRAITYYEKALKVALQLKDVVNEGMAYCNLGNSYQGLRDYQRAITYYEKHLKMTLELQDRVGEANSYRNLGVAYHELKDHTGAIMHYKKALNMSLELKDKVMEGNIYGNLGSVFRDLNKSNEAEKYFKQNIKISEVLHHQVRESKWQISFFEEHSSSYRGLELALLQQNKLHEALEVTDRRRARALSSLISRNASFPFDQKNSLEPLKIQQIKQLAKKLHTTFIIYSLSPINRANSSLQSWIISSEGEFISALSLPFPYDEFLTQEHIFKSFPYQAEAKCPKKGEKRSGDIFKEKLSSWYNCLIAPLEPYLPAKKSGETLTFILEGYLTHLPFGAFYNEKEDQYLIENYPVSVAPSMGVLSLLDELPQHDSGEVLLMGNPVTLEKEVDELKLAEKEVSDILAPLLGLSKDEVFIQERATPMCVLVNASQAKLVHIACHGVAHQKPLEKPDPHSVFEGLFKLAIDADHPLGHLHAAEIASMSLKADLVFMSACHLGRGNLKKEGSIGPVWSFLGAGAKSVIASYWPLPEGDLTVKMVETFYQHYWGIGTPHLNKAKALQQAVVMAMAIERDKPRQWGSLFLTGLIE
ncbi:MAG: tetratricopeptide repeat protein [Candidatus Rhabdochlamydia sp.]